MLKTFSRQLLQVLIVFFIAIPTVQAQNTITSGAPTEKIEKKPYYKKAFDKKAQKSLKKADKKFDKGKKYATKANGFSKKANLFKKEKNKATNDKARKKAQRKIDKAEQNSTKQEIKALTFYGQGNEIKYNVYRGALGKLRNNSNAEAAKLEKEAQSKFQKANNKRNDVTKSVTQLNLLKLREAYDLENQALSLQVQAMDLYAGIKPEKKKDDKKPTGKVKINRNNLSNREKRIFYKVNMPQEDIVKLNTATDASEKANALQQKIEANSAQIEILREKANKTTDSKLRTTLKNQADKLLNENLEKNQLVWKINAESNEVKFKLYQKYLADAKPKISGERLKKALDFEKQANKLFLEAEKFKNNAANSVDKRKASIDLMKAVDAQLSGLENIENALGVALNLSDVYQFTEKSTTNNNQENIDNNDNYNNNANSDVSIRETDEPTFIRETEIEIDLDEIIGMPTKKRPASSEVKKLAKSNDFVFRIQFLIAYRVSDNIFGGKYAIIKEKKKKYTHFLAGDFKSYEGAEEALKEVRQKYKDAYIVTLIAGKKTSLGQAKSVIDVYPAPRKKEYDKTAKTEVDKIKKGTFKGHVISSTKNRKVAFDKSLNAFKLNDVGGLMYTVQLGAFNNAVEADFFKGLKPIYAERMGNKLIRYTYGDFATKAAADKGKSKAKNYGFTDAYVVAFNNGEKIKLADASKYKTRETSSAKPKLISGISSSNLQPYDVRSVNGTFFSIQLGVFQNQLNKNHFNGLSPIYGEKLNSGAIRYSYGEFGTYNEAAKAKQTAARKGFADGYVIAFRNGKKIAVNEAKKTQGNRTRTYSGSTSSNDILFKIQVAAYKKVPSDIANRFAKLSQTRKVDSFVDETGVTIYTMGGSFRNYKDADKMKDKLHAEGLTDCFVIAVAGNKKMRVADARKKLNQ